MEKQNIVEDLESEFKKFLADCKKKFTTTREVNNLIKKTQSKNNFNSIIKKGNRSNTQNFKRHQNKQSK